MRSALYGTMALVAAALLLIAPASVAQMGTGFDYDEATGEATGTYVSFVFDESTGTLTDYTLSEGEMGDTSVTVFTEIAIENWSADTQMGQQPLEPVILPAGAVWTGIGAKATVRAIDNPVGNLAIANVGLLGAPSGFQGDIGQIGDLELADQWLNAENTVTFTLGEGLTATFQGAEGGQGGYVNISGDDFRGFLFVSNGTFAIAESTVTVHLEGPQATFFHGLPLFGMDAEEREFENDVAEAAANGDVGARVDIDAQGNAVSSTFRTSFAAQVTAAVQNRVSLDLTSSDSAPTIVVVEIPGNLVDLNREIRVTLDGEVVEQVPSLEVLVEAKSQGVADPRVHLLKTDDALKLSIYVPGFSTKSLTVEALDAGEPFGGSIGGVPVPYVVAGIAALIILVGVAAAVKRRK